jgi:molybdopterin converting factor subunit 1
MDDQAPLKFPMTITVKLFAILREKAGTAEISLELPNGARVEQAIATLLDRKPDLATWVSRAAFAVNMTRVSGTTILNDKDELALLPPVSGG